MRKTGKIQWYRIWINLKLLPSACCPSTDISTALVLTKSVNTILSVVFISKKLEDHCFSDDDATRRLPLLVSECLGRLTMSVERRIQAHCEQLTKQKSLRGFGVVPVPCMCGIERLTEPAVSGALSSAVAASSDPVASPQTEIDVSVSSPDIFVISLSNTGAQIGVGVDCYIQKVKDRILDTQPFRKRPGIVDRNALAELETVKKGTPLYGQPAWWGEDADSPRRGAGEPGMDQQTGDHSHPHRTDARQRPIVMEIPHRSTTPERDKQHFARDESTPARSVTSSLSKDSLVLSPDSAHEKSAEKDSSGSGEGSSNLPLSFTVEFGDEKKPRMNIGGSLREFVPTKILKSLAPHLRGEKGTPPKGQPKEPGMSRKSSSEERDLSPGRQRRLDELWEGKPKRHSSGHKPPEGRKSSPRGTTSKSSKSKQSTAATIAASVHQAQYADPTAYLIDKMFAGATGSNMDSPRSQASDRSDSPAAPEHAMYKEAAEHDRACQRGSLTYRSQDKPPAPKQKSSSGSPASKTTAKSPEKPPVAATSPEKNTEKDMGGVPVTLPVAPSPVGDQEDKVSEAGTYTIEGEKDDTEEMMARQQIDEVFGVDVENFSFERPVVGSGQRLVTPEDEEGDRTLHDDEEEGGCRTPCDENDQDVFGDVEAVFFVRQKTCILEDMLCPYELGDADGTDNGVLGWKAFLCRLIASFDIVLKAITCRVGTCTTT
ncbi:hypothetical protein BaRGS_00036346 [Batillaria attramentaria]|uniref:Uncharacterized protein n=1 Tax=Batillaria attramentaria TaxID=370345 RepID=A0ABD0JBJ5_9CAEN